MDNSNKINCQIVDILLNKDLTFSKKYRGIFNSSFLPQNIYEEHFKNKGMKSIKVDYNKQSLCFTEQADDHSFSINGSNEKYKDEIHIHCNDLYQFEELVDYLSRGNEITEVNSIPHYDDVSRNDFSKYELVLDNNTNEVDATKSLVRLLSSKSKEAVFRAVSIVFGEIVNDPKEIEVELVKKLDKIYTNKVKNSDTLFFSQTISNDILNIQEQESSKTFRVNNIPSREIDDLIYNYSDDYSNQ